MRTRRRHIVKKQPFLPGHQMTRFVVCTNQLNTIITVSVIFLKKKIRNFSALSLKPDIPSFEVGLFSHSIPIILSHLFWIELIGCAYALYGSKSEFVYFESIKTLAKCVETQAKNNCISKNANYSFHILRYSGDDFYVSEITFKIVHLKTNIRPLSRDSVAKGFPMRECVFLCSNYVLFKFPIDLNKNECFKRKR